MMEASPERWLQLAEMMLDGEESKALWSGEMEKSWCSCEGTPLGLLRMLITYKHKGKDAISAKISDTRHSDSFFSAMNATKTHARSQLSHKNWEDWLHIKTIVCQLTFTGSFELEF